MKYGMRSLSAISLILASSLSILDAKVKLSEAVSNSTINGFALTRFTSVNGRDAEGSIYQFVMKPTVETSEVNGWTFSTGIVFVIGSSTPNDNYTHNTIQGSRAVRSDFSGSDTFNIADYFFTKKLEETKTSLRFGAFPIKSAYSSSLDRGVGFGLDSYDNDYVNLSLYWYDSWISDNIYIRQGNGGAPNKIVTNGAFSKGIGIGNDLIYVGLTSSKAAQKETGLRYSLWLAHIQRLVNIMSFADVEYNVDTGDGALKFLGQLSITSVDPRGHFLTGATPGNRSTVLDAVDFSASNVAKTRGVINVSAGYTQKLDSGVLEDSDDKYSYNNYVSLSLGAVSSIFQGYGTLLHHIGGFKTGGAFWSSFIGDGSNGFNIIGTGGLNNSRLLVPYTKLELSSYRSKVSLDLAYIKGSNVASLGKGIRRLTAANAPFMKDNKNQAFKAGFALSFFEVTPTYLYSLTKDLTLKFQYSATFGDFAVSRVRTAIRYNF